MFQKILCMGLAFMMLFGATVCAETTENTVLTATELLAQYPGEEITKENADYFFDLKKAVMAAEEAGIDLRTIPNYDNFQTVRWKLAEVVTAEATSVNESAYVVVTLDTFIPAEKINKETVSVVRGNQEVNYTIQKGEGEVNVFRVLISNQMWDRENLRLRVNFGVINYSKLFCITNDIGYDSLMLTTAKNQKIDSPNELVDGKLNVSYQISNNTYLSGISDFTVYTAVYDCTGSFVRLAKEPVTMLNYGQKKQISFSFANLPDDTGKISSFVWHNNNLKPLIEKKDVQNTYGYDNVMDPTKDIHVSFIGGSITQGERYSKPFIEHWQKDRTGKITVNNAGVGGTGSSYGVMRFEQDVLSYHPDIVFVEFTLNDQHRLDRNNVELNIENMLLQCLNAEHIPVIVFIHIPDRRMLANKTEYGIETNIQKYNKVIADYGLTSLNLHQMVLDRLANNSMDNWDNYILSNNVHPTVEQGARIAEMMYQEFSSSHETYLKKIVPKEGLLSFNVPVAASCQNISPFYTTCDASWVFQPEIRNVVTEGYGDPIENPFRDYIGSKISGSTLTFQFTGTRILITGLTGDMGRSFTYVITDSSGNVEKEGTGDNYLKNYKWYEEPTLVVYGLEDTKHTLTITVTEDAEADAAGKMFGIGEIWVDEK